MLTKKSISKIHHFRFLMRVSAQSLPRNIGNIRVCESVRQTPASATLLIRHLPVNHAHELGKEENNRQS